MSNLPILKIDEQILKSDKIICRHISNLSDLPRGQISQDILSQLRQFVEHILLKFYAKFAAFSPFSARKQ